MATFVCTEKCTYGNPPRFYGEGDKLIADLKEAPKHFKAVSAAEQKAADKAADEGKALSEAGVKPGDVQGAQTAAQTAPESCNVKELAEKLGVEQSVICEASGKARWNAKLTSDEVAAITAAVAKAAEPAGAADAEGQE